uniref:Uncharacterized protein n=1 Tax=viral metagenome TaxID=1070528 RepID=A0A6C0JK54_9ZZZZ
MSEKFGVNWNYGANDCFYLSIKDSIHNKKLSEKFLHFIGKKEHTLTVQILRDYTSEHLETIVHYFVNVLLNIPNDNLDLFKEELFFDISHEIYTVKKHLMDKTIMISILSSGEHNPDFYVRQEDMIYLFKNIINDKITDNETKRIKCVNYFKKNIQMLSNGVTFIDIFTFSLIYKNFIKSEFNETGKIIIFNNYNRPPKEFKKDKNLYIYYKNYYYQAWVFKNFSKYTIYTNKFRVTQNTGAGDCYYLSVIDSMNNKKLTEKFLNFIGEKYNKNSKGKDITELTVQILRNYIADNLDYTLNMIVRPLLNIPIDNENSHFVKEDIYKVLGNCASKSCSTSTSCSNKEICHLSKEHIKEVLEDYIPMIKKNLIPSVYESCLKSIEEKHSDKYYGLLKKDMLYVFKNIVYDKTTDNETKIINFINYYKNNIKKQYVWVTFIEVFTFAKLYEEFIKSEFNEKGEVINLYDDDSPPIDFEKDKNLYLYHNNCHYRAYVFKNFSKKKIENCIQNKSKKIIKECIKQYKLIPYNIRIKWANSKKAKEFINKYKLLINKIRLKNLKTKKLKSLKK